MGRHGPWEGRLAGGVNAPCAAGLAKAHRIEKGRALLIEAANEHEQPEVAHPEARRVAVIPSSLPIAEVTSRLTELQAQYPDAEVHSG